MSRGEEAVGLMAVALCVSGRRALSAALSDGDAIRSVEVCGQLISTTQSTVDEMGDIALSHRFDL